MCFPKTPNIPTPEAPQAIKQPTEAATMSDSARRSRNSAMVGGGTLLTGPSGVAPSSVSTGRTTLLGG